MLQLHLFIAPSRIIKAFCTKSFVFWITDSLSLRFFYTFQLCICKLWSEHKVTLSHLSGWRLIAAIKQRIDYRARTFILHVWHCLVLKLKDLLLSAYLLSELCNHWLIHFFLIAQLSIKPLYLILESLVFFLLCFELWFTKIKLFIYSN